MTVELRLWLVERWRGHWAAVTVLATSLVALGSTGIGCSGGAGDGAAGGLGADGGTSGGGTSGGPGPGQPVQPGPTSDGGLVVVPGDFHDIRSATSWAFHDLGASFQGGTFDGRYLYLAPRYYAAIVARYD